MEEDETQPLPLEDLFGIAPISSYTALDALRDGRFVPVQPMLTDG